MTETAPEVAVPGVVAPVAGAQPARDRRPRPVPGTARGPHPALEKLFELHPSLFGARFHPLKLGTFEDIMARHPGVFKKEDLKIALGQHARSTRYLECVAMGEPRHDLDGQPVEPVSPEHVFHAVVEVFRRRQGRGRGDPRPWLHQRLLALLESAGLTAATITLTRPVEATDCFRALAAGEVDLVSIDAEVGDSALAELGLTAKVEQNPHLMTLLSLHVIAHKSNARAVEMIGQLDAGLIEMYESGEWYEIVSSALARKGAQP